MQISTTEARKHLTTLITRVQDPRESIILTRHGEPVAGLVSMPELKRIWKQRDIENMTRTGQFPNTFTLGRNMEHTTVQEAAEEIQRVQMDRAMERSVLKKAGLDPFPGGELDVEVDAPVERPRRRWWMFWRRVERGATER